MFRFTHRYFLFKEEEPIGHIHPLSGCSESSADADFLRFLELLVIMSSVFRTSSRPVVTRQHWRRGKDWPLKFLLNFIYGVVVGKTHRVTETMVNLHEEARYYPEGIKTATESARVEIARPKLEHDRKIGEKKRKQRPRTSRSYGCIRQIFFIVDAPPIWTSWTGGTCTRRG